MKKTILSIIIVLGMGVGAFAQDNGLFGRGFDTQTTDANRDQSLVLPAVHGGAGDTSATSPLGGGVLLLAAFGVAYALKSKRKE